MALVKPKDEITTAPVVEGGAIIAPVKPSVEKTFSTEYDPNPPSVDPRFRTEFEPEPDEGLDFGEKDNEVSEIGLFHNIFVNGYLYKFRRSDYPSIQRAIREAMTLVNYEPDFRSWFSENLSGYYTSRADGAIIVNDGQAMLDFEKMLVENPYWTPDPYHEVRQNEIENYNLTRDEAIQYLGVTIGDEIRRQYDLLAESKMKAEMQRDAQIEEQKKIEENTRKSNENLLQYLQRAFAAPEGTSKSFEDFFARVVPRLMSTVPAFGTIAASQTGNPMDAFQFYVMGQQMQNLMYPFMYQSKSGKTQSWARPIYNIKNYYPQTTKVRIKRKVRG